MKTILQSLRILLALTALTGFLYPLAVTGLSHLAFPHTATGSLVKRGDLMVGSALLAQKTESPAYFWPRPSAADYGTVASGASNQGPTSDTLKKAVAERRAQFGDTAPVDLLTASGSGLDPHISPEAAKQQAERVARERKRPLDQIESLIAQHTEGPQLGIFGEPRVNVLALNLALDAPR